MWLGEQTQFKFDVAIDPASHATQDIVVEVVTTCWTVTKSVRTLCEAMAEARGTLTPEQELARFLRGLYNYTLRELERQGGADILSVMESLDPETVTERLRILQCEAENLFSAQAYVLDAALSRWGYFIGNVQFSHSPRPGVVIHRTVPIDAEELVQALTPWVAQLPHDEAREAFMAAVEAASRLEGAKCRELMELASVSVPPITEGEATADTEPPKGSE